MFLKIYVIFLMVEKKFLMLLKAKYFQENLKDQAFFKDKIMLHDFREVKCRFARSLVRWQGGNCGRVIRW